MAKEGTYQSIDGSETVLFLTESYFLDNILISLVVYFFCPEQKSCRKMLTKNTWIENRSKSIRRFHVLVHFCQHIFVLNRKNCLQPVYVTTYIQRKKLKVILSNFYQHYWKKLIQVPRAPPWLTFKCNFFTQYKNRLIAR